MVEGVVVVEVVEGVVVEAVLVLQHKYHGAQSAPEIESDAAVHLRVHFPP